MGELVELRPKKRYLVTKVETTEILARSEQDAERVGKIQLGYFGGDTTDIQVEEIVDSYHPQEY